MLVTDFQREYETWIYDGLAPEHSPVVRHGGTIKLPTPQPVLDSIVTNSSTFSRLLRVLKSQLVAHERKLWCPGLVVTQLRMFLSPVLVVPLCC